MFCEEESTSRRIYFLQFLYINKLMAAANEAVLIVYIPKKLKHVALKEVHYQLVNTCLIISSLGWRNCWRYHGGRVRPRYCNLFGERNYCIICQINKTFNLDKIYNLDKYQDVFNNFLSLKKEFQIFLNNGYSNFWLYHYNQQYKLGSKRRKIQQHVFKKLYRTKLLQHLLS